MSKNNQIQCVILAGGKGSRLDEKVNISSALNGKTLLEHAALLGKFKQNI